jgi:hypothetical protein
VRSVFEVDGLFDGARPMTNAAIVVDGEGRSHRRQDLGVLMSPKGVYVRGIAAL